MIPGTFNNIKVAQISLQKHLGIPLTKTFVKLTKQLV